MQLKYFNINDSLEALKARRREYAKKYFPDKYQTVAEQDKATAIMQEINAEYDFVTNAENRLKYQKSAKPLRATRKPNWVSNAAVEEKQAQNLFHALTNGGKVDMILLIDTLNSISNHGGVIDIYQKKYNSDLLRDVYKYIKDERYRDAIANHLKKIVISRVFKGFAEFLTKNI